MTAPQALEAPEIKYLPVTSSQILAWGYDAKSATLGIKFVNGGSTYHYFGVPMSVVDELKVAPSIGSFVGKIIKGKYAYEKQPDVPGGEVFGLRQTQEPKYTVSTTGRICNRSTGKVIPDDEPILILRAKDIKAVGALWAYFESCTNADHRAVVKGRIVDFEAFAKANPERMKEPDSSLQDVVGRTQAPWPFPSKPAA